MRHLIGVFGLSRFVASLLQGSVYEAVLGVHDGSLAVFHGFLLDASCSLVACGEDFLCRLEVAHIFLGMLVVLE